MTFPCVGTGEKTWTPTQEDLDRWTEAYPALNIATELRQMEAWIQANPQRRKTVSGMPRFVVNWLNRSQNRAYAQGHVPKAIAKDPEARASFNQERAERERANYFAHVRAKERT